MSEESEHRRLDEAKVEERLDAIVAQDAQTETYELRRSARVAALEHMQLQSCVDKWRERVQSYASRTGQRFVA